MPATIQGNWTVQLISSPIDQRQRFVISGATTGNGTYYDDYTVPFNVEGSTWTVVSQEEGSWSGNPGQWINSNNFQRSDNQISNGYEFFTIGFDDYRGGVNYDDLVLKFSRQVHTSLPLPPVIVPDLPIPPVVVVPLPDVPNNPSIPPPPQMSMGRVFTKIEDGDKLPRSLSIETYGIWFDITGSKTGNMLTFYTCSSDTGSFKKSAYNAPCFDCNSVPHFDIAYGNDAGSGSRDLGGNDFYTPSNAIYGQYRSLCLDPYIDRFKIGNKEINHFYVINVHTDRMGDRIDEGNVEINIAELSGSQFLLGNPNRNAHTGSNVKLSGTGKILRLIDDSILDLSTLTDYSYRTFYQDQSSSQCFLNSSAGPIYKLVSGSLEQGIFSGSNSGSNQPHVYGLSFPKQGIFILDADLLDLSASFLTVTGSDTAGDNSVKLLTAMSGAALYTDLSGDYLGFQARKVRYNYEEQYFIRVKNQEYNFTNNSTFVTGSDLMIKDDFVNDPKIYISEIGLYNEQKELLAIAKLSYPIQKTFTEESLFEIKLAW